MDQPKAKILIIDDEAIARMTLEALLGAENYSLEFAENGAEGLLKAIEALPDIILLDVMMPGMSGYEVCEKIRSISLLAEVPILMITALDDSQSRLAGLKAGADDFITKPFNIFELLARLQNMARLNRYRLLLEQREQLGQLHDELVVAYDKTIEGWSQALDLRDKETEGHTRRVTDLTLRLAFEAGLGEEALKHIWRGSLLHDVGKLGIPDAVLLKPEALTPEEWVIMKRHPVYAYQWLSTIAYLRPALEIPYCHHERWDGSGYPRGLQGEDIPLSARLFAIVDVWDALTSHRPYRQAGSQDEARAYILGQIGRHFDPRVVELFLKIVAEA